jgi:hypothetical protein
MQEEWEQKMDIKAKCVLKKFLFCCGAPARWHRAGSGDALVPWACRVGIACLTAVLIDLSPSLEMRKGGGGG